VVVDGNGLRLARKIFFFHRDISRQPVERWGSPDAWTENSQSESYEQLNKTIWIFLPSRTEIYEFAGGEKRSGTNDAIKCCQKNSALMEQNFRLSIRPHPFVEALNPTLLPIRNEVKS